MGKESQSAREHAHQDGSQGKQDDEGDRGQDAVDVTVVGRLIDVEAEHALGILATEEAVSVPIPIPIVVVVVSVPAAPVTVIVISIVIIPGSTSATWAVAVD